MSGSLITLPLRLGVRGAVLGLRGAGELGERALGLAGVIAGLAGRRSASESRSAPTSPPARPSSSASSSSSASAAAPASPAAPTRPSSSASAAAPVPPSAPSATAASPVAAPAPVEPVPAHVSEEAVLVMEVADPGAQDGAGAEIRVAEPWDGYRAMRAPDVVDRITAATTAELAAVQLYELSGRRRQTVLDAVQAALRKRA